MEFHLPEGRLISDEVKARRIQDWDAFFSRVEKEYTSTNEIPVSSLGMYSVSEKNISDSTSSVLSLPPIKHNESIKIQAYKSFRRRFKKSNRGCKRKQKKIVKSWQESYRKVCNRNKNNYVIDKNENTANKKEESNILFSPRSNRSKIVNSNNEKVFDTENSYVNSNEFKHSDISAKIQLDTVNTFKNTNELLMENYKCKQQVVQLEKLEHLKNVPENDKNINKIVKDEEPQNNKNYSNKKIEQNATSKKRQKNVLDDNNTKCIEYKKGTNLNRICEKLADSNHKNNLAPKPVVDNKHSVGVCDKVQLSEKAILNNSLQNCEQEKLQYESTTQSCTQEKNNSVYSTSKRKDYNGFCDTFDQVIKKRKTTTLYDLLNPPDTETTRTKKRKKTRTVCFQSDNVNNIKIDENESVILLTLEDFLNGTFNHPGVHQPPAP